MSIMVVVVRMVLVIRHQQQRFDLPRQPLRPNQDFTHAQSQRGVVEFNGRVEARFREGLEGAAC